MWICSGGGCVLIDQWSLLLIVTARGMACTDSSDMLTVLECFAVAWTSEVTAGLSNETSWKSGLIPKASVCHWHPSALLSYNYCQCDWSWKGRYFSSLKQQEQLFAAACLVDWREVTLTPAGSIKKWMLVLGAVERVFAFVTNSIITGDTWCGINGIKTAGSGDIPMHTLIACWLQHACNASRHVTSVWVTVPEWRKHSG